MNGALPTVGSPSVPAECTESWCPLKLRLHPGTRGPLSAVRALTSECLGSGELDGSVSPLSSLNHPCLEREQHRGSRKGQTTQQSGMAKPRLRPGFLMPSPVGLSLCLQRSGMRVSEIGSPHHIRLPQRLYLGDLSVSAGTVFTGVTRFRPQ